MSTMVCAGMFLVANTPRPVRRYQYVWPCIRMLSWHKSHTFGGVGLDDQMRTAFEVNIILS